MDSPEVWRWVWLVAALVFGVGEMATAGSFFLLPFAVGALVAALLAFLGLGIAWELLAFVVVSAGTFAAMRPLAHRLDRNVPTDGVGAKRLIGEVATVLEPITDADKLGLIRIDREEWRAESVDGEPIDAGTRVRVVEVRGTRAIVFPVDDREIPERSTS